MPKTQKIGFVGLGTMGLPMASCLVKDGFSLAAFDLSETACSNLAAKGATIVPTATLAAQGAAVLILMLPTINVVQTVLDSAIAELPTNALIINMSTVSPAQNIGLLEQAKAKGLRFIEAPVARGPDHAAKGELSILLGGDAACCQGVNALFESMGETIQRIGDVGAASALKLATNYLGMASNIAAAEALAFAKLHGIDESVATDFMMQTAAGKGYLGTVFPGKVLSGDVLPGFPIELVLKDLKLVLDASKISGMPLAIGDAMKDCYAQEIAEGRGRNDLTVYYRSLLTRMGLFTT